MPGLADKIERNVVQRQFERARHEHDSGASAVEYALLAAAVAAIIALTVFVFGTLVLHLNQDNCATIRDTASPGASCG